MTKDNHYAQEAEDKVVPLCPKCGRIAMEKRTKYGLRAFCCGLWSWDRFPLVDAATHKARNEVHKVFDVLWRDGATSRKDAYKRLAQEMSLTKDQCHIKLFDVDDCHRAMIALDAINQELQRVAPTAMRAAFQRAQSRKALTKKQDSVILIE